jgi:hypothetical protein
MQVFLKASNHRELYFLSVLFLTIYIVTKRGYKLDLHSDFTVNHRYARLLQNSYTTPYDASVRLEVYKNGSILRTV